MLRRNSLLTISLLVSICLHAQRPIQLDKLLQAANSDDQSLIDKHWANLVAQGQPVVWDDSVVFVYRGKANAVFWNGDFNSWGRASEFHNKGTKIGVTDIWILRASFPTDARLDYKINVDGNWIVDPNNKFQQWTGYDGGSANSELRMPLCTPSKWIENTAEKTGTLTDNIKLKSKHLGYDINVKYYLPHDYDQLKDLSVIYVTDGHEYADKKLGSMIEILDNLIEQKETEPLIAVFIDPREITDLTNNRRESELTMNPLFVKFLTEELIPYTDANYKTSTDKLNRAVMGTSFGGLCASYAAAFAPQLFGKVAIQSPAYWFRPEIYDLVKNSNNYPAKISMSTGTIYDTQDGARQMKKIFQSKSLNFQYLEVNEGHSWGNWRALIDDQLIFLFPYN